MTAHLRAWKIYEAKMMEKLGSLTLGEALDEEVGLGEWLIDRRRGERLRGVLEDQRRCREAWGRGMEGLIGAVERFRVRRERFLERRGRGEV